MAVPMVGYGDVRLSFGDREGGIVSFALKNDGRLLVQVGAAEVGLDAQQATDVAELLSWLLSRRRAMQSVPGQVPGQVAGVAQGGGGIGRPFSEVGQYARGLGGMVGEGGSGPSPVDPTWERDPATGAIRRL
jgi:hypothetical protein